MSKKISKSNIHEIFKLSTVQKGMFYTYLKEEKSNVLNIQVSVNVDGSFDELKLKAAVDLVVKANETLRSVFRWENVREPIQIILKDYQPQIDMHDFSDLSNDQLQSQINHVLQEDQDQRFDLSEGSVKFSIIKTAQKSFIFSITNHHILYDGWSTGIIFKEIFEYYQKLLQEQEITLSVKRPYKSFSEYNPSSSEERKYWTNYLEGIELENIHTQRIRSTTKKNKIRKKQLVLPLQKLKAFCQKNKVTIAEVIYSIHGILLSKLRNNEDLIFGATVSSRDLSIAGFNEVVGNFINVVPIRYRGLGDRSLLEVVLNTHDELLERSEFNNISYYEIKKLLKISTGKDLFDSAVVIENYPIDKIITEGTDHFSVEVLDFYESIDIPLVVSATFLDDLELVFAYNMELIDPVYIDSFAKSFVMLLDELLEHSEAKVTSVQLVPELESVNLSNEGNDVAVKYSEGTLVLDLIEEQLKYNPQKISIIEGNNSISYAELHDRMNQVVGFLHELHAVRKGDLVGVILPADQHLIMCLLGVLKLGACFVPIDPRLSGERRRAIIKDSGIRLILTKGDESLSLMPNVRVINIAEEINWGVSYRLPENIKVSGSDLCYIIYTSGSTGVPKGVMIEHNSLSNYLQWASGYYVQEMEAVFPLFTSISFDLTVTSIFLPLITGNQMVIYDNQRPEFAVEQIFADKKANIIKLTPSHLRLIKSLNIGSENKTRERIKLIVGGEELEEGLAKSITDAFSGNVEIYNEYGPTEATVGCMIYKYNEQQSDYLSVPIGSPIANTAIYILDSNGSPVPAGVVGELYIAGAGLAKGYLNDKQQTARKFLKNPFGKYPVMYKSGDLAVRGENGEIIFKGRIDSQVKIQGYRIELEEVNTHIRRYKNIKESVLKVWKEDDEKYLVAYLVGDKEIEINKLRNFLAKGLPDYMMPRHYVVIDEIPLTINGKVDMDGLAKPHLENRSAKTSLNAREVQLIEFLAATLKLSPDQIGVEKSFFELGVDSLRAILFVNTIFKEI